MRIMPTCEYLRCLKTLVFLTRIRGGFVLKIPEKKTSKHPNLPGSNPNTTTSVASSGDTYHTYPLFAGQILMLVDEFSLEIPYISQEDIKDRSKADVFTKLFALGQSG